jgi:hypothetical protein
MFEAIRTQKKKAMAKIQYGTGSHSIFERENAGILGARRGPQYPHKPIIIGVRQKRQP